MSYTHNYAGGLDIMNDVISCLGAMGTTIFLTTNEINWENIIVATVSALLWGVITIGGKVLTSYLHKKGIIDTADKENLDNALTDLGDDGKINGSNKD